MGNPGWKTLQSIFCVSESSRGPVLCAESCVNSGPRINNPCLSNFAAATSLGHGPLQVREQQDPLNCVHLPLGARQRLSPKVSMCSSSAASCQAVRTGECHAACAHRLT